MRLILIRHYKTKFNASGHIMGWGDSPQVENWVEDLEFIESQLTARAARPDFICSSALGRARQTAEYFVSRFNLDTVQIAPELNEINYGTLYKKSKKWVAENYPLHKKDPGFVYPEGESFNQLQSRCVALLDDLAARSTDETVLCVVHAGVIRAVLSHFLGLDFSAQLRRKVGHRYIGILGVEQGVCSSYDEWGQCSGFVSEGAVTLPYTRQIA